MNPLLLLAWSALPKLELAWPQTGPGVECPRRAQVLTFLGALAPRTSQRNVLITAQRLESPAQWRLMLGDQTRSVPAAGPCDQQAATIAAVIDRLLRAPRTGPTTTSTTSAAPVERPGATLRSEPRSDLRSDPPPAPPKPPATTKRDPAPDSDTALAPPGSTSRITPLTETVLTSTPTVRGTEASGLRLGPGAFVAVGTNAQLRYGAALGAEYRWTSWGLALRAAWWSPHQTEDARTDELVVALGLQRTLWRLPWGSLDAALQGAFSAVWLRRQAADQRTFRANPELEAQLRYRLGWRRFEPYLALRGRLALRIQRFLIDGAPFLELPRFQANLCFGVQTAFF